MTIEATKASPKSSGQRHYLAYLEGADIGRSAAMTAKCFECCGGYIDGRVDCGVKSCPIYPWMPYAKITVDTTPISNSDGLDDEL